MTRREGGEFVVDGFPTTTIVRTKCGGFDGVVPDGFKREAFLKHLETIGQVAKRYAFAVYPLEGRALHWAEWESWESQPWSGAGGHWITELVVGPSAPERALPEEAK